MNRQTTAFRLAWSALSKRRPVALARIDCPGRSFYVATDNVLVGGQAYEPILGNGVISTASQFMSTTLALATAQFTLIDKRTSFGSTTIGLLWQYQFVGAPVTIWLWEKSLSDPADALQRFVGNIATYSTRTGRIDVTCTQSKAFNQSITPRIITREEFPQCPDSTVGLPLPTYYGNVQSPPMRAPHLEPYGLGARARELVSGGRRVGKGILVDTGRGTGLKAKVIVAGHPCYQIGNLPTSYPGGGVFIGGSEGTLHALEIASTDFFNSTTDGGAGFYVTDSLAIGRAPFFPSKCVPAATDSGATNLGCDFQYPENANALSEPGGEYAPVRFGRVLCPSNVLRGSKLTATLPSLSVSGTMTALTLYVSARAFALTSYMKVALLDKSNVSVWSASLTDGSVGAHTPYTLTFNIPITGSVPATFDALGGCKVYLYVDTAGGNAAIGLVDVFFAGISASYIPDQSVVRTDKVVQVLPVPMAMPLPFPAGTSPSIINTYQQKFLTSNTYEFVGNLYANVSGWADDGSGTYTGTPGALIQRITDVLQHMLVNYGSVPGANIVTESGMGSFTDARALLRTWTGEDMVLGFSFAQQMQLSALLSWVMTAGASDVWCSTFDGRWRILPWTTGLADTYPRKLSQIDLMDPATGPELVMTPDSDVLSSVIVNYGHDDASGAYAHAVSASGASSSNGHLYHSMRDGHLNVTAGVNDVFTVQPPTNGGLGSNSDLPCPPMNLNLTPGGYTRESFTTMMAGLLQTVTSTSIVIVATVNDKVPFTRGANTYTVTIPGGTYTQANFVTTVVGLMNTAIGLPAANAGSFSWSIPPSNGLRGAWVWANTTPWSFRWDLSPTTNARAAFGYTYAEATPTRTTQSGWSLIKPWSVGFNGVVVTGANDRIPFRETSGGTVLTATMDGGTRSMDAHAAEAQRALNVASSGWTVTWSRTAQQFTFARAAGGQLVWDNGVASAATTFGFGVQPTAFTTSIVGPANCGEELQWSMSSWGDTTASTNWYQYALPWRTGDFGFIGARRSCAELMGFDPQQDDYGVNVSWANNVMAATFIGLRHLATTPKFMVEAALQQSDDVYGGKVPVQIDGRCISDTKTAVELRNRLVAVMSHSRGQVAFATETCPDLERGDTFGFSLDMDTLRPYGVANTDGSWTGKSFRVTEEHGHFGDTWHSEIVAVDLTD